MTEIRGTVKFDQALWDARSAGYRAETPNPYLATSSNWAAWEAGRAFGLGRISQARGCAMNVQVNRRAYRISFDELASAPDAAPLAIAILRKIDTALWQRVKAKAALEGVTVKALIERLLREWVQ